MRRALASTALLSSVACHERREVPGAHDAEASPSPVQERGSDPAAQAAAKKNAERAKARAESRASWVAGTFSGPYLGAMRMQTSVMHDPAWTDEGGPATVDGGNAVETTHRLGYLRHGAKVAVLAEPVVNDHCLEGWYELVEGGYVCGRYGTLDLRNPRVRLAPHPPDLASPLPYPYAQNLSNGTPLYRRVLSLEDRKKYEPWLIPVPVVAAPAPPTSTVLAPPAVPTPKSDDEGEAVVDPDAVGAGAPVPSVAPPPPPPAPAPAPPPPPSEPADAPWFMRSYDGGKPQITLDELHGRGVLVRRMVRGFYLALDKEFHAAHAHWWRTTSGFAVPFERIVVHPSPGDFHGEWLLPPSGPMPLIGDAGTLLVSDVVTGDAGTLDASHGDAGDEAGAPMDLDASNDAASNDASAPVDAGTPAGVSIPLGTPAFIVSTSAQKYLVDGDHRRVLGATGGLARRTVVALTGATTQGWSGSGFTGGHALAATGAGYWVRLADAYLPPPPPAPNVPVGAAAPAPSGAPEKWIDVDLTHQTLVAYEGERPVYATFVSSGRRNPQDKAKDYPTPTGTFRIREKHVTATMDGDVAADGPYSIEDVPWVMYFQGSYALHGAFWHANFSHPASHGCVNLSPADARALFFWSEPALPTGWHGVFADAARPGTRVVIHD